MLDALTTQVSVDGSDIEPEDEWVTKAEHNALVSAGKQAAAVMANTAATQAEVDAAVAAMSAAQATFDAAKKPGEKQPVPPEPMRLVYRAGVEGSTSWQDWVADGQMAGTTGQGKRLEGLEMRIENPVDN